VKLSEIAPRDRLRVRFDVCAGTWWDVVVTTVFSDGIELRLLADDNHFQAIYTGTDDDKPWRFFLPGREHNKYEPLSLDWVVSPLLPGVVSEHWLDPGAVEWAERLV